jgi:hypothetical protein
MEPEPQVVAADDLLTFEEAARRVPRTAAGLRYLVKRGVVQPVKYAGRLYVTKQELRSLWPEHYREHPQPK